jgi:rhamnose transport system ATP-binding protein
VTVLSGADIAFSGGQVHALIGENGAGKSTLVKLLSGAEAPDSGHVEVDGQRMVFRSPRAALAHGIYRVPQEPVLVPDLTVAENVFLGVLPRRSQASGIVSWSAMMRQAGDVFARLDLHLSPRAAAVSLSIAEQQLVECARAIAHDCRAVLFDEPTSPLSPHEVACLFEVIDRLRADGCAVGFISHRLDEVFEISDMLTVLKDGMVVASATRQEADRADLVEKMIGRALSSTARRASPAAPAGGALAASSPLLQVVELAGPRFAGISFSLWPGEILGFAGLVGSGRTEIAESIVGLRPRDGGQVLLDGTEIGRGGMHATIQAGLVYVPEDRAAHSVFGSLSMAENVSAADLRLIAGHGPFLSSARETANANMMTSRLGIRGPGPRAALRSFSGGNQQKAVLGRWLLTSPRAIILDEPTRGIDAGAKQDIYKLLDQLADDQLGIIVISSEIEELVRLCDRVIVIYEGQIVTEIVGHDITMAAIGRAIVDPASAVPETPEASRGAASQRTHADIQPAIPGPVSHPHVRSGKPRTGGRGLRGVLGAVAGARETSLVALTVVLAVCVGLVHGSFTSASNIEFMLVNSAVLGLVATGETFVLLGRGIDLSVAPIVGLGAVVTGVMANDHGLTLAEAIPLALAIGAVLGLVNGVMVAVLDVPPIIATLGTLFAYSGIVFLYLNGREVDQVPASFSRFGNEFVLPGVQLPVLVLAVVAVASWVVLRYTALGRAVLSIGGAREAARNAGISVRTVTALTYIASGAIACFAGLVYVCYTGYAVDTTGTGTSIELTAIAAALIGGISIAGGRGNPIGSVLGSIFLSVTLAAVVSLHIPAIWEPAGQGVLILIAVAIDAALLRRSGLAPKLLT